MRVCLVAPCSARKRFDPRRPPVSEALEAAGLPVPGLDLEREREYRRALSGFALPAREMYLGVFSSVRRAADEARLRGLSVSLYVMSARYGLISELDTVIPYDATLSGMGEGELREWASSRRLAESLARASSGSDLLILALFRGYLRAVLLSGFSPAVRTLVLSPPSMAREASRLGEALTYSSVGEFKARVREALSLAGT